MLLTSNVHILCCIETNSKCEKPTITETTASSLVLSFNCSFGNTRDRFACRIDKHLVQIRPTLGDHFTIQESRTSSIRLSQLISFTAYEIRVNATYNKLYFKSHSDVIFGKTDPVGETTNVYRTLCLAQIYFF